MKIKEVAVSVGETFPKKYTKYATWRVDIGYTATVEDGESHDIVRRKLYKKASQELENAKESIYETESR